ncbi:MAG TPA: sugar ABC transporter ATP-binding protein [Anaerolineales bacterium]|nr:sugar ABC transporter ATP-binding protein [Anaerolineales bacterium]
MAEPYLRMVGIQKSFPGVQALKGVDFEAFAGEALALIGANGAGKSTLMNVLGGVIQPDAGQILIAGQPVEIHDPLQAAAHGIAFVHQEMAILRTLTIAENLYITSFPTRNGLIDFEQANRLSSSVLARLGHDFPPETRMRDLSPGDQQIVEIARALLGEPRLIIFDEPTSSLTSREKARLFEVIRSLKKEGVTVIYITHLLDEVFGICERAVVLRNGETVGGGMLSQLTYAEIVRLMIGTADVSSYFRHRTAQIGDIILKVSGLNQKGVLSEISFELRKGEVLGLWGLMGSGRTELSRAIIGLDPIDSGSIEIRANGSLKPIQPRQAKKWIGMVTENRREEGLLLPKSVKTNISLANLPALISRVWPLVDNKKETQEARTYVDRLKIMISSLEQPVETLSGGNQQKVVVGRWLQRNPVIYIMDEPTRGLDVGAKAEIRTVILELADAGAAVILVSSDIDQIMSMSDRYLVMNRGRITQELPASASKDELIAAAAGGQ